MSDEDSFKMCCRSKVMIMFSVKGDTDWIMVGYIITALQTDRIVYFPEILNNVTEYWLIMSQR